MILADRADAGRRLAARLQDLRDRRVVVLGLPRGGVPVAFEVARALGAPLDVIIVRKLGVPFQPELAMGAVGEDGGAGHQPRGRPRHRGLRRRARRGRGTRTRRGPAPRPALPPRPAPSAAGRPDRGGGRRRCPPSPAPRACRSDTSAPAPAPPPRYGPRRSPAPASRRWCPAADAPTSP
ncbi:MAG TPA: phosphoribosyltransferase family protein, partial [Streptosporangiaceae bacterium]|nr:phosphoribosyltransferase family protein [Streptosporangiaceae bacterium]